jgi:hypothetical protein
MKEKTQVTKNIEYADALFNDVLGDCLSLREQRRELYGNSWLQEDGVESNFWGGIVNKVNRLKILHKHRDEDNSYESYEDNLKDLIILSIFTLASLRHERQLNERVSGNGKH